MSTQSRSVDTSSEHVSADTCFLDAHVLIPTRSLPIIGTLLPILGFLFLTAGTHAMGEEPWFQFQGPNGDGITRESLPTEWSEESNVTWRSELPGNGWSTPVTDGERIYLTAAIPAGQDDEDARRAKEQSLELLIVDAKSGELIRQVKVMDHNDDRPPKMHAKNSHASPTPIVTDDRVYVHFGYQGTACMTKDGDLLWLNRDLYFRPTHGNGGSPILVGDRLIFTCDGDKNPKVVALNAETGDLEWERPRPVSAKKTFSFCTPSVFDVDGKPQVIVPGSDCVLALDPQTGETIWDLRYTGYSVVPKPVYGSGLVFLSTGFDSASMLAIRPTGSGVVTDTHLEWRVDKNVPKTPSMIVDEGLVYSVSDDGIMMCVEAQTGDVVYRKRVGGNYSSSLLLAGDYLYLTSEDGLTTVIRRGPEFEKVAENDLGERTLASLAALDQSLLIRTADALYRIDRQ